MGQIDALPLAAGLSRTSRAHYHRYLLAVVVCLILLVWKSQKTIHTVPCHEKITYANVKLIWDACGEISGRRLECSRIDVPMDHFNTSEHQHKTFNLPVIRLRGYDNATNLWLNPGGPGVSGIKFIRNRGEQFAALLGLDYHLVSIDSRGIGDSKPQALCYASQDAKESLAIPAFQPLDRSSEAYAWAKNFVRSCEDITGEHGQYINTVQTAMDINTILDAIGQKETIYWGFSYGTILGQTYATMFPDRVHRMIIDGVDDMSAFYEDRIGLNRSLLDTERVLYGFFDECMKAEDCSLAGLANTTAELQSLVLDFAKQLIEEPLSVYIDNSYWGVLKYEDIIYVGLLSALYNPSTWRQLADRLTKLIQGDATDAFMAWGGQNVYDSILEGQALEFISGNDGLSGIENWPQGRKEGLELALPSLKSSLFSGIAHRNLYIRQLWSIPKRNTFKQRKRVKTAHPLLILNTKWDPVCPLASAKAAQSIFEGSQLVEIDGYGHCSFANPSTCVEQQVRDYLKTGIVPERPVKCEIDEGPFVKTTDVDGTLRSQS